MNPVMRAHWGMDNLAQPSDRRSSPSVPGHDALRMALHTSITTGQYTHVQHLADAPAAPIVRFFCLPRWQISVLKFDKDFAGLDVCLHPVPTL